MGITGRLLGERFEFIGQTSGREVVEAGLGYFQDNFLTFLGRIFRSTRERNEEMKEQQKKPNSFTEHSKLPHNSFSIEVKGKRNPCNPHPAGATHPVHHVTVLCDDCSHPALRPSYPNS